MVACLRMADVEVAIGLRRKASPDLTAGELQVPCEQVGAVGDVDSASIAEADSGVHPKILVRPAQVVPVIGCGRRL